ncbi:MAG: lyase family protein, partial [Pseudomonadota bacterium]
MARGSGNKMWGGRFKVSPSDVMERINASVAYDQRFAQQDLAGSKAHAEMLSQQGIISKGDAKAIVKGLATIAREIDASEFDWSTELEDVHMNVESRLRDLIGPAAGRLHTARSRNDQVAT